MTYDMQLGYKTIQSDTGIDTVSKALLESSNEAVFVIDRNANFISVNQIVADRLNQSMDKLLGTCLYDYLPKEIGKRRKKAIDKAIKTKKITTIEEQWDGIHIQNRITPISGENNEIRELVVYSIDITRYRIKELRKAKNQLIQEQNKFKRFIENVPAVLFFISFKQPMPLDLDEDSRIAWFKKYAFMEDCNESYLRQNGYEDKKEVIGTKLYDLFSQNDELFQKTLKRYADSNYKVRNLDFTVDRPNSPTRYYLDNSYPLIENNLLYSISIISVNITENKKLEDELKQLIITKDQFISLLSHDIKGPLANIYGLTDLLEVTADELSIDDVKKIITLIKVSSKNGLDLLEDLLNWLRSKQGRIDIKPQVFELLDVVNKVMHFIQQSAVKKGIRIHTEIALNHLFYADPTMIETVLRNLLTNAIKFTPRDGDIWIKSTSRSNLLTVNVRDNGVGMDKQKTQRLFKTKITTPSAGTEGEKGTGFGLLICKEFIEQNNGHLNVQSTLGKGSTFSFQIPNAASIRFKTNPKG